VFSGSPGLGQACKFILSINDLPEIMDLFNGFTVKPVEVKYFAGRDAAVQAGSFW
jgi:hypothetical protein